MGRHSVTPDDYVLTLNGGSTATVTLQGGATTVTEALSSKTDGRYLRIHQNYDGPGADSDIEFVTTLLPDIDGAKKQSRWLRCAIQIRAISGGGFSGALFFKCGTAAFGTNISASVTAPITTPTMFVFYYPINGSNGGINFWQGAAVDVKLTFSQWRSNTVGQTNNTDIDFIVFDYGESDNYLDVDVTSYVQRAGVGSTAWLTPALCLPPDSNGAYLQGGNQLSYTLDRIYPPFLLPGTFSGLEVWESITSQNYSVWGFDFARNPLSAPISSTPAYEVQIAQTRYTIPPNGSTGAAGWWVWGGGPGDTFNDANYGRLLNGWTGVNAADLLAARYLAATAVGTRSHATQKTYTNSMKLRVYYDAQPASSGALLMCEA